MFYDSSEPEFPNWWDQLGESGARGAGEAERVERAEEIDLASDMGSEPGFARESDRSDGPRFGLRDGIESLERDGIELASELPVFFRVEEEEVGYDATRSTGRDYARDLVLSVWQQAEEVPGLDPDLWRRDEFGSWIHRLDYGKRGSRYGWEIFDPGVGRHAQGVYLMRPMQWERLLGDLEGLGA